MAQGQFKARMNLCPSWVTEVTGVFIILKASLYTPTEITKPLTVAQWSKIAELALTRSSGW